MTTIFQIDKKFTKELHRRLKAWQREMVPGSDYDYLPSATHIGEMLLTMLWTSLQREEGRETHFTVGFGEPLDEGRLALIFKTPKPFTTEELRKLAPSVAPPMGLIGVWPRKKNGDWLPYRLLRGIDEDPNRYELCIWGLQTTSLGKVLFRVVDPGRITVSMTRDFPIAEITGQHAGFISRTWRGEAVRLLSRKPKRANVPGKRPLYYALEMYVKFDLPSTITEEILIRIRLLGHGGTIIFVPDSPSWQRSVEQPMLYSCDQVLDETQQIREFLTTQIKKAETDREGSGFDKGSELTRNNRFKDFIGKAARTIAHLTLVDGATILSDDFKVLSFGVKLKLAQRTAIPITVVRILPLEGDSPPAEVALDQEFRGTRHLSAAQFVFAHPRSVAFVVSQDGGITGFTTRRLNGKNSPLRLLAYRSLELLF